MAAQPPASGNHNPRRIAQGRNGAAAPAASAAAAPSADTGASKAAAPARPAPARRAARRPRKRWHIVVACLVTAALLVAGLAVGGFAYLRWFAGNDAADIQGTWYLAGTNTPITITENRICLTDDVSYPYTLDEGGKTIQFSFSNLAGSGCYRFSLDRQQLALVDGQFSGTDTLGRDIPWMVQAVVAQLQGGSLPPAEAAGKGLTLLSREPAGKAAAPAKDAGEKGAADKDAAQESDAASGKDAAKESGAEGAKAADKDTAAAKDESADRDTAADKDAAA